MAGIVRAGGSKRELELMGRTSSDRMVAARTCGVHYAELTMQGFNKDDRSLSWAAISVRQQRVGKPSVCIRI